LAAIATACALVLAALGVGSVPADAAVGAPSSTRLVVGFRSDIDGPTRAATLRGAGAALRGTVHSLPIEVVDAPGGAAGMSRLSQLPGVTFVEADARFLPTDTTPNDPYFPPYSYKGGQWGFVNTQAPKAWDITTGSPDVAIAIVDSGVAPHPDFGGQLVTGYNVLDGSTNTNDTYGHGTHVAGVAAAATNNATGIAGYCWQCKIMPIKAYATSSGAYSSDLATGVTWATDHGARVVNMSLAGPTSSSALGGAIGYARQHGVVVLAAAGNSGCNCATYPASNSGVIAVGGTDQFDTLYSDSNYGSWVDVAAPGQNLTLLLTDSSTGSQWGYGAVGGTSLATPVVAGVAGLLASAVPSATGVELENALMTGVDPVTGTLQVASGRTNAYKALQALGAATPPPPPPPPTLPSSTALPVITGTTQAGQTLSASTGTWSGAPTAYASQWSRCDSAGASCATLAGATSGSYGLTAADVGSTMRVTVTASNSAGSSSATSPASGSVVAAPAVTKTVTWSGSLNPKNLTRSYSMTVVTAGASHATLSFSCKSLSLTAKAADGSILVVASGASVLNLDTTVPAGTDTWVVTGTSKCSFTLTVTAPA
jgi:thermitase